MKRVHNRDTAQGVIVIGAGPAGMMAAVTAARGGAAVTLWDQNGFAGKKLNITGKGRCNVTNLCGREELLDSVVGGRKFLYSAFSRFGPQDTVEFFRELGVPLKVERGRRVFPESERARDITDALTAALDALGVRVRKRRATGLVTESGAVTGVRAGEETVPCGAVVLATGGLSYPLTGSDGSGYALARAAGHTVSQLSPSLVPLASPEALCGQMQGLSLRNVTLSLLSPEGAVEWSEGPGEMLFTHFGVSGPLVLSASAFYRPGCGLRIDLKPGLSEEMLDARLLRDLKKHSGKTLQNALVDLLHKTMIPVIIEKSGLSEEIRAHQLTREGRKELMRCIKRFPLDISGPRGFDEAVVTRGGVSVREINPSTMESKLVQGLYFAGEIIDADALTGGFNLQIAWSTGHAAGSALAQGPK